MGLSRRFLNLIVESDEAFTRSLRRIDLKRLQLFYPTPPPPPPAPIRRPTTTMESILLPDPILKFKAHSLLPIWALFSCQKFWQNATVVFSLLFSN
jgi:hypothetical protein